MCTHTNMHTQTHTYTHTHTHTHILTEITSVIVSHSGRVGWDIFVGLVIQALSFYIAGFVGRSWIQNVRDKRF